jgi:glycerol-3-phosphate acyltransferase PlsY
LDTILSPSAAGALSLLLVSALAYVIGSFPTGALIARVYHDVDLTRVGSERTGATIGICVVRVFCLRTQADEFRSAL